MALAKSIFFSAISGQLGGTEFANVRSGLVLKRTRPPRAMFSPDSIRAKAEFQAGLAEWRALDPDVKQQWRIAAPSWPRRNRLGGEHILSPLQFFLTRPRDYELMTAPVTWFQPPLYTSEQPTITAVSFTAGGAYTFTADTPGPGLFNPILITSIARFLPEGSTATPQRWLRLAMRIKDANYGTLTSVFALRNITLIAGERICLRLRQWRQFDHPSAHHLFFSTVI